MYATFTYILLIFNGKLVDKLAFFWEFFRVGKNLKKTLSFQVTSFPRVCGKHGLLEGRSMGFVAKMVGAYSSFHACNQPITGWWFQIFIIFTPTWGNDPISL